MKNPKN